jgi:hypothetical protein
VNISKKFSLLSKPNSSDSDLSSKKSSNEYKFAHLENYDDIWHFEVDLTDEEFLQVVLGRLQKLDSHISYKIFQNEFLPKHKKPSFKDYARFRKLEILLTTPENQ